MELLKHVRRILGLNLKRHNIGNIVNSGICPKCYMLAISLNNDLVYCENPFCDFECDYVPELDIYVEEMEDGF